MNQDPEDEDKLIILSTISDLLTDICEQSTKEKDTNKGKPIPLYSPEIIKYFLSKKIPNIDIKEYLKRMMKYTKIEASTLILILVFIDRLGELNNIRLNYFNIHKLILAAMVIAIKYNEDDYFANEFYAKVGGITKAEMDRLEYEFLALVDFTLFVGEEIFNKYRSYLLTFKAEGDE